MMGRNQISLMKMLSSKYLIITNLHYVILLQLPEIQFILKHKAHIQQTYKLSKQLNLLTGIIYFSNAVTTWSIKSNFRINGCFRPLFKDIVCMAAESQNHEAVGDTVFIIRKQIRINVCVQFTFSFPYNPGFKPKE